MPVRRYVLAIILFWTATTGWLIYREVWSQRASGEPPPVNIDLPDEVGKTTHWAVFQGDRRIGVTISEVKYHRDDDTYELHSYFQQQSPVQSGEVRPFPMKSMRGYYRVTREGELRAIEEEITLAVDPWGEIKATLTGTVQEGILTPKWQIFALGKHDFTSPPI